MKKYGMLDRDLLNTEQIIKYVTYELNPNEGTWTENEQFPEEYFVGLGYDTQQHKADLMIFR